ncbi:MAG: DUF5992 family protein [Agarilytica sp.]
MNKFILSLTLFLTALNSLAGELIKDATISTVGNTSSGGPDFFVRVTGGVGPCSDSLIKFPESEKASEDSYKLAMTIALAAFNAKNKVRIHNFTSDSCSGASFISVSN